MAGCACTSAAPRPISRGAALRRTGADRGRALAISAAVADGLLKLSIRACASKTNGQRPDGRDAIPCSPANASGVCGRLVQCGRAPPPRQTPGSATRRFRTIPAYPGMSSARSKVCREGNLAPRSANINIICPKIGNRGGHHRVAEHRAPLADAAVAGDQHGAAFIAAKF
jgi:hypothetical protein